MYLTETVKKRELVMCQENIPHGKTDESKRPAFLKQLTMKINFVFELSYSPCSMSTHS